jgi:hypothetical protein
MDKSILDFWLKEREQKTFTIGQSDLVGIATSHCLHFDSHEIFTWDVDKEMENWHPQYCDESKSSHKCWQLLPTEWVVFGKAEVCRCPRCGDSYDTPLTLNGTNRLGVEYTLHCSTAAALAMVMEGLIDEDNVAQAEWGNCYCDCQLG